MNKKLLEEVIDDTYNYITNSLINMGAEIPNNYTGIGTSGSADHAIKYLSQKIVQNILSTVAPVETLDFKLSYKNDIKDERHDVDFKINLSELLNGDEPFYCNLISSVGEYSISLKVEPAPHNPSKEGV